MESLGTVLSMSSIMSAVVIMLSPNFLKFHDHGNRLGCVLSREFPSTVPPEIVILWLQAVFGVDKFSKYPLMILIIREVGGIT